MLYWDHREKGFWPSILFLSVVNKFQSLFVSLYVLLYLHQEAKQILNVQELDPEVIQKVFE